MNAMFKDALTPHSGLARKSSSLTAFVLSAAIGIPGLLHGATAQAGDACTAPGCAGTSYSNMPEIAAIGSRTGKYMDIPESAKGPAVDPAKGYRLQDLGKGLFVVTENVYQSMFLVYEHGVVVVDAPPSIAPSIPKAIAEVTDKPITHLIYSHSHTNESAAIQFRHARNKRGRLHPPAKTSPTISLVGLRFT